MYLALNILYTIALMLILFYSFIQINLTITYIKKHNKKTKATLPSPISENDIPFVSIQLPVYNEKYVVERLLDKVVQIRHPKHLLEIQVLDDSTDETKEIIDKKVAELKASTDLDIVIIRRTNRTEYKAGALKDAMPITKGEFIAIFDADFLPSEDFLEKTLLHFQDNKIGMVQTRWGHINRNYSLLTRAQSFALDAHFTLDQGGRAYAGHLISFNGTAGVWRKSCIIDAGNWDGGTISEDLDLSYRAQLKDWKLIYLEDVISPAELPITIDALKSQQFRWNKGTAEVFQRMKSKLWNTDKFSFFTKTHAYFHLLSSSIFLNIFLVSILSLPLIYLKPSKENLGFLDTFSMIFLLSTAILIFNYWTFYRIQHGRSFKTLFNFIKEFFVFLPIITSFALHNAWAAIKGHFGEKSEFVRTPKFNLQDKKAQIDNQYIKKKVSLMEILEGFLACYFLFGVISAFYLQNFAMLPFHLILTFGYSYIFYNSVWKKY